MPVVKITAGQPSQDAYIHSTIDNNFNGDSILFGANAESSSYGYPVIQFDLSSIPKGAIINSAYFNGVVIGSYQYLSSSSIKATPYRATRQWDETTVKKSNQPTFVNDSAVGTVINGNEALNKLLQWDITPLVKNWVENGLPNYGMFFYVEGNSSNTWASATIGSKTHPDSTKRWHVVVDYTQVNPDPPKALKTPNGGESWDGVQAITWDAPPKPPIVETVENFEGNTFAFSNTGNWERTTVHKKSGNYSFKNASIPHGGTSTHEFTLPIPMGAIDPKVRFNAMTESEANYDIFKAYLNGSELFKLSGATTWMSYEFPLAIGNNAFRLEYKKDASGSYGQDAGFIDDITVSYTIVDPVPDNSLQYHIQLTTDNGVKWKDIVGLTSVGATSFEYDFKNEPSSSLAKIRIRSYRNGYYSSWIESAGVFTIQHNVAPSQPTNLSPNGGVVAVDLSNTLTFQHNDLDGSTGDIQSKFDLQWRKQGEALWNDVTAITTQSLYVFAPNTLPLGTIEWRVRTYDSVGLVSTYSEIAVFNVAERPPVPTILSPTNNATVPLANPTLSWSAVDQAGFIVTVKDETGSNTLWTQTLNSGNKALTIGYALQNNTKYIITLTVKGVKGLYSSEVQVAFTVSYTPPIKPLTRLSVDNERGFIEISITNPQGEGTEPEVTSQDIFRQVVGEKSWFRVATNVPKNSRFIDYLVQSEVEYQYTVRAFGSNGTFKDSDSPSTSISLEKPVLASVSNPSKYVRSKLGNESAETNEVEGQLAVFAGRKGALAEFGFGDSEALNISFLTTDQRDLKMVKELLYNRETLIYRDPTGRCEFVVIFSVEIEDVAYKLWKVTLSPNKVYYVEGV